MGNVYKVTIELDMVEYQLVMMAINNMLDKDLEHIKEAEKAKLERTVDTFQTIKDKFYDAYFQEVKR